MKSPLRSLIPALVLCLSVGCSAQAQSDKDLDLRVLMQAYSGAFSITAEGNLLFPDGTVVVYDDALEKSFDQLLETPDVQDMMSLVYPTGRPGQAPPGLNFDPGRFRPDLFFRKLYGSTEAEIRTKLRLVQWMPSKNGPRLQMTTRFGIDKALEKVIADLEKLGNEFHGFLLPPGGAWNFRKIAQTERLSMHSFGIAVDIAVAPSDYWLWDKEPGYRNRIPWEIVEIFERHGFIWGGRWYHYDTMHFEYRPELLLKARLLAEARE